ncbi:hypothetical protein ACLMJK_004436 [Lecanora helva]
MPPPKDKPNPLAPPGYEFTETIHSETYPAIDSSKANLHGKCVFICGASKGIGRAIAVSFAKAGATSIAIGARSDLTGTAEAIQNIAAPDGISLHRLLQVKVDVTDRKSVEDAARKVESHFGQLDILVNNAGVFGPPAPVADSDPDIWWNTWDINLHGPYLVTRAFLPLLLKGGSKQIVYVSSVGAWVIGPGISAYQPSKLALNRFAEFVDKEYSEQGVVAFSINPGNVPGTDILGPAGVPEHLKHIFTETPELSADTIVHLTAESRPWLGGRYVSATWDMPQLLARKDEIVSGDKLKARMVY